MSCPSAFMEEAKAKAIGRAEVRLMDLSKLIEWVKLSPQYIGAIFIAACVLLFAPESIQASLGISTFVENYRSWIGAVFVASGALLISHLGAYFVSKVTAWNKKRLFVKYGKKRLHNLTPDGKGILRGYIQGHKRSQILSEFDGIAKGLVKVMIIYRASNIGSHSGFAYNIQPWAWDYLNQHLELLDDGE